MDTDAKYVSPLNILRAERDSFEFACKELRAENERLLREREVLRDLINTQREGGVMLRAENERLRALLKTAKVDVATDIDVDAVNEQCERQAKDMRAHYDRDE